MISKLCKCCFQVFEWSLEISTHFMRRRKKRCESLIVFPVDSACFYAIDFIERSWTVWRMTKNRTEKGIFLLLFSQDDPIYLFTAHGRKRHWHRNARFLVRIRSHQAVLILKKSRRHRTTDEHITQQCDTNIWQWHKYT